MTTFRMHNKKKNESMKSGMGEDERYNPIWPFYEALQAFLKDVYECCSVINTEENQDSSSTRDNETGAENELNRPVGSNSEAGNTTTKQTVAARPALKRRAKNPPELAEAGREMQTAFSAINRVLDNKKPRR